MEYPEVWLQLGYYVHQDFLLQYPDLLSGLGEFFSGLKAQDQRDLLSFLDSLLGSEVSDQEIAQAWSQSGAGFVVVPSDARVFLEEVRAYLAGLPPN